MTDPITLTKAELRDLTGFERTKKMIGWLEARGWVFEPPARRGDIPKVDRAYYLARMSGRSAQGVKRVEPSFDFMLNPS